MTLTPEQSRHILDQYAKSAEARRFREELPHRVVEAIWIGRIEIDGRELRVEDVFSEPITKGRSFFNAVIKRKQTRPDATAM